MLFSISMRDTAQAKWDALLERAGEIRGAELRDQMARAEKPYSTDVILAANWICGSSPLSDLANYDLDIFLSCAEHGVYLRGNVPYAADVPEDIFLNYVLHIRVNEEELCDCRQL